MSCPKTNWFSQCFEQKFYSHQNRIFKSSAEFSVALEEQDFHVANVTCHIIDNVSLDQTTKPLCPLGFWHFPPTDLAADSVQSCQMVCFTLERSRRSRRNFTLFTSCFVVVGREPVWSLPISRLWPTNWARIHTYTHSLRTLQLSLQPGYSWNLNSIKH